MKMCTTAMPLSSKGSRIGIFSAEKVANSASYVGTSVNQKKAERTDAERNVTKMYHETENNQGWHRAKVCLRVTESCLQRKVLVEGHREHRCDDAGFGIFGGRHAVAAAECPYCK